MADTHGQLEHVDIPEGDVLIIAGDVCRGRSLQELKYLNNFFGSLPHAHKVLIAGNHDLIMEQLGRAELERIFTHAVYLEDSGITIDGLKFWGSPWQPEFFNWAFNLPRGKLLAEKWAKIPDNTDVLITHGPPFGILDRTLRNKRVGCEELLKAIGRIKPKVHVFGHIHEDYGQNESAGTLFVNASTCNARYQPSNKPIVIDV